MPIDDRLRASLEYSLGPIIMTALSDPAVVEIICNSDGNIWVERQGQRMEEPVGQMDAQQARLVLNYVASGLDTTVDIKNPIVEGELPLDGSRFEGSIPPICSAPQFVIRKKAAKIFSLGDYVEKGIMSEQIKSDLQTALVDHKNILVIGGTGSGKTTLVNGLILELSRMCPYDRLIIIEDTMELQSKSRNTQFLRTSIDIKMTKLLAMTLRERPDRILVGEVRDGAALDLLKAWNTGHPGGVGTLHANSALEGLTRLQSLVAEAEEAPPYELIGDLIGKAVDLIIFIRRDDIIGRRISEVLDVKGYDISTKQYNTEYIYRYNPESAS